MPKCDACRAEGATQRCSKCQGCWSCDKACAKSFWPTHKKFCTDDPALKPHVAIELAIERALAKQPKTEVPPDATCYICLESEGPQNGDNVTRGCACRGPSAGFAHVDCLVEMASRNEWMVDPGGGGQDKSRWVFCPTCGTAYVGSLAIAVARRLWRRDRMGRPSYAKYRALENLAEELKKHDEIDAARHLHEESTRGWTAGPAEQLRIELTRVQGHYESGRYQEALEMLTRLRPSVDRDAGASRLRSSFAHLMARVLTALDRWEDALASAVKAVEHGTKSDGPESQFVLDNMQLRAQILAVLGRVEEAKVAMKRVVATQTRVLGADHRDTLLAKETLDVILTGA